MSSISANPLLDYFDADVHAARLKQEFAQLRRVDQYSHSKAATTFTRSLSRCCVEKNRYSDVLSNDITIYPADPSAGYICGNLLNTVSFFLTPLSFVACQAPTPSTFEDFWSIVFNDDIPLLIMLTQLVENGHHKADKYWPNASQTYGDVSVLLENERVSTVEKSVIFRTFAVTKGSLVKRVTQIQFFGWPDFGIPLSTEGFQQIVHYLDSVVPESKVLVHCSAGIGRTGTLIGVYVASSLLRQNKLKEDSIKEVVGWLKTQRCGMVQKLEQYCYIYRCVHAMIAQSTHPSSVPPL